MNNRPVERGWSVAFKSSWLSALVDRHSALGQWISDTWCNEGGWMMRSEENEK
jgi:hypothetical protein